MRRKRSERLGVRELSDGAAAIKARYEYDVYGKRTVVSEDQVADIGFTGHYEHSPSGTTLMLYRAYDASIGRWLSEDPSGFSDGPNRYSYVHNNPPIRIDPSGAVTTSISSPRYHPLTRMDDLVANCRGKYGAGCTKPAGGFFCDGEKDQCGWRPKVRIEISIDVYYLDRPGAPLTGAFLRKHEQLHVDALLSLVNMMRYDGEVSEAMRFSSKWECEYHCEFAEKIYWFAYMLEGRFIDGF
jgi:RHS repeat-associated protein